MNFKHPELTYKLDPKTLTYIKKPSKVDLGKMIRCYVYARVSDKSQVDSGNGIDNQISICKQYAKVMGYEVVEVFYDEAVSGRLSQRKDFDKMIECLKKENKNGITIDYVIISEYSRFSRNQKLGVTEDMEDEIKATGCHLKFEKGGLSTDNKNDEYALDMEKIKAKHESIENADRTLSRMTGRMYDGYYVLAAPPGYSYEKVVTGKNKTKSYIKVNREQFEIIKEGLEGYANGIFRSHTQLLKFYNSKLLKANSRLTKPGHLNLTFIQRLLALDRLYFYCGFIIYPRFGIMEPVEAKHEVMIGLPVMHKILHIEAQRTNGGSYGPKQDTSDIHPLRGLLYCVSCNRAMTSIPGNGNGGKYYYYGCNRKDCPKNYFIPVNKAHEEFTSLLNEMKPKPEILFLLDDIFINALNKGEQSFQSSKRAIRTEINELDRKINHKMELINKLSKVELIVKVENEIGELIQRKSELEERVDNKFIDDNETKSLFNKFKGIVENPVSIWELGNKDLRKMLVLVLFDGKLYYNKKNGYKTIENEHIYAGLGTFFDTNVLYGGPNPHYFEHAKSVIQSLDYRTIVSMALFYNTVFNKESGVLNKLSPEQKKYYQLA